jgi:penicillin-binding protein 2
MAGIIGLMCRLYFLMMESGLQEAAAKQSSYKLEVASLRGTIYDRNMTALTGVDKKAIAAVSPTVESANYLAEVLPEEEKESVFTMLSAGKPFLMKTPNNSLWSAEGINTFWVSQRYQDKQMLPHVLGYLDGSGAGISGIEKAFDGYLSQTGAQISVKYPVDALNRVLPGEQRRISDTSALEKKGVVLTIDSDIQRIAEIAAKTYLKRGAVIVAETGSCDLRAVASMPNFSPNNIADVLDREDSPMLNRAFSAFMLGSIFKLVPAAAALEHGYSGEEVYHCTGGIEVGGTTFHCINGQAHGEVDMNKAIAYSCNCYFIHLAQEVGRKELLDLAKQLGFGKEQEMAPGLVSASGTLPSLRELTNQRALANFSFGQGTLTATPLQIVGLINAVVTGGSYTQPRLVEGLVDENGDFVEEYPRAQPEKLLSSVTTDKLMNYMYSSVEFGTSSKGKPEYGGAGAKTATAETGIKVGDQELDQAWYAGYYPANQPKYIIVVLAEDGDGGGKSCGPVFKQIADMLHERGMA